MFTLITFAACLLALALLVCMVMTDVENADRAEARKNAARVTAFDTAARAARNCDGYARLGASANR